MDKVKKRKNLIFLIATSFSTTAVSVYLAITIFGMKLDINFISFTSNDLHIAPNACNNGELLHRAACIRNMKRKINFTVPSNYYQIVGVRSPELTKPSFKLWLIGFSKNDDYPFDYIHCPRKWQETPRLQITTLISDHRRH